MNVQIMSSKYCIRSFECTSRIILDYMNPDNPRIEIHHGGSIDEIQLANNERVYIMGRQSIHCELTILSDFHFTCVLSMFYPRKMIYSMGMDKSLHLSGGDKIIINEVAK